MHNVAELYCVLWLRRTAPSVTTHARTGPFGIGVLLSTLAGAKGNSGYLEGSGIAAKFNRPEGCAVSPDGQYVFVAGASSVARERRTFALSSAHFKNKYQR